MRAVKLSAKEQRSYLLKAGWVILRKSHSSYREYWCNNKIPIASFDRQGAFMMQKSDEAEEQPEFDKKVHLLNTGWIHNRDHRHPGSEFWAHHKFPDKTFSRNAAIMQQTWWEQEEAGNVLPN